MDSFFSNISGDKSHSSPSSKSPKGSNSVVSESLGAEGVPGNTPKKQALFHMKMAEEASKRSEQERQRRLQLQEEQDLAYAIALSKAEAASLKGSS